MTATKTSESFHSNDEHKVMPPQLLPVTPVGILAEKLQRLRSNIANNGVNKDTVEELRECSDLASGLDEYVSFCTSPESDALKQLAEDTVNEDWNVNFCDGATVHELEREMLSGHVEGQLLKFLIGMTGAQSVLEIGMFTGYSALAMAEQLLENHSPDLGGAAPRVVACELDPYTADFAKTYFAQSPAGKLIDVRVGPALDTLQELAVSGDQFDFVFIDADKTGYLTYYKTLLDHDLLTEQAVICVDNTLLQGQTYATKTLSTNGQAVAEFNRFVASDPRVEQVLLPIRDGVTLIRRISGKRWETQT